MPLNSATDDDEFRSLFSKLLSLLNLKFGCGNNCWNCCQALENISQQIQNLQTDVRQLQQVVSKGFEEAKLATKEQRYPFENSIKKVEERISSTEDEITCFSQEQPLLSPTGTFPKRFSDDKARREQSSGMDNIDASPEHKILSKESYSDENSNTFVIQRSRSLSCERRNSDCLYTKPSSQQRNIASEKEYSINDSSPLLNNSRVRQSLTTRNAELSTTKDNTLKPLRKHKAETKETCDMHRQTKVARGLVSSQKFGKITRIGDQGCDQVSFSQTPSPTKETSSHEITESTSRILEHLPKESSIPKVTTEYKDNNGNCLCTNPVIRSKEERMKMKGSTCTECQKTWNCLAHNNEERCKEMIQKYSRHRHCHTPPETPEFWFDISFPETETIPPESPLV
ncbi:hypothetical protein Gasu2_20500 [Galdieria sulphuraria]|uniref:DNA endonuclease activator Ctp1 C-terminal domain-containing protein n=1 Tax=Galdieria sulphuraria TaxID=130081 RepID=M2X4C3_GALSU|nr:uncharacterized protein Gasu_15190 [Galdieria sulphuraria]EME31280.1 hypothetical protein Gasu_15190 [Galdieria sulphuraria]GJD07707.1 hypothetical protein Gasu2_20500 [Galdieria sulphuraria]|eukprot:XP_005707800.1 hypothetical protein Gasu_15190 [Galdieria sulphuraria]